MPTKSSVFLSIFCCLCFTAGAQVYDGLRVALFDFQVMQVRGKTVMLKCKMANTGRSEAGLKKNAAQTVVELDSINLPPILWGHEAELAASALNHIPRLQPGEISTPIWLDVSAGEVLANPQQPANACPDLLIDTAYIYSYNDTEIGLRYHIRNAGNMPVEVSGKAFQLAVNIYFVSGSKLTRGAIPAGNTFVQTGRETLNGWLRPGQKLCGEVLISLKNRTKFVQNLLLELAPPSSLSECDRTNNTRSIEVKY